MTDNFNETSLETAIVELFKELGYTHESGSSCQREHHSTVLLKDDLKTFLAQRYAHEKLTTSEMERIVSSIEHINGISLYEQSKAVFKLLNSGFTLIRDDGKPAVHIEFIDYDDVNNNHFKVVNQFNVEDVQIRVPDVLIFINGIPVTIFEFKSAIKENTTMYDAWEQIHIRYQRDIPKLLRYTLLSVISDGANSKMASVFTPYDFYYAWRKQNAGDKAKDGISSLITMMNGAFARDRLIAILKDFIFYPDDISAKSPIVCRYPQFFASNRMLNSIKNAIRPQGNGKGGTYFGATGCGKTYTMLYLTRQLVTHYREIFNNPTIIIITDREDLDSQTSKIFVDAKEFLKESDIKSIESRADLAQTLRDKPSGGIYLTTVQKFSEEIGLLSDRSNIICISDEAHRTQVGVGEKLNIDKEKGVTVSYGFAKYLRDGFPNATYCGFTGTPIDETLAVFGNVVDSYTMKEASDDGITVRIAYEPRLARVLLSDEKTREINEFYKKATEDGSNENQVEKSKREMASVKRILGDPDRLKLLAKDMVSHYEQLIAQKPNITQKAMVVCASREIAYELLQQILTVRPEWGIAKKSEHEETLSKEQLDKLIALPKVNLVATRDKDDEKALYDLCGTKEYRQELGKQFKNNESNFKIAIVVDMWITGFDVPSLAVMYIDKPLQKHTLIQTISRVNRVFEGKDQGLVVDYIGIKESMLQAIKQYGESDEGSVDDINATLKIFRNELALTKKLMHGFNDAKFFNGTQLERLYCLNQASEFVQTKKDTEKQFMLHTRKLKSAYDISVPTGLLTSEEISLSNFYIAIRAIIYKQTKGTSLDASQLNKIVEKMVADAMSFTGVESIVNGETTEDILGTGFSDEIDKLQLPISRFNALILLLKKTISDYAKTNRVKSIEFDKRMQTVVERYNNRDNLVFASQVTNDFINELSDEVLRIMQAIEEDKQAGDTLGISFEEKAFYDILIKVRDIHEFKYDDDKCLVLAKKIKELVDDKARYQDFLYRDDIKNTLSRDLTVLLYQNGYPPEWNKEVFEQVLEQAENFQKYR